MKFENYLTEKSKDLDAGKQGKKFERVLGDALKMVGLDFDENASTGAIWDIKPKGQGWDRLISNKEVNIKLSRAKWMVGFSELYKMLPWDELPKNWDKGKDNEKYAKKVKRFFNKKGLNATAFLKAIDGDIEKQIIDATKKQDVATLKKLFTKKNFQVQGLGRNYDVRVLDNGERVTSVAVDKGGKVFMRSEKPRAISGTTMVTFRTPTPKLPGAAIRQIKERIMGLRNYLTEEDIVTKALELPEPEVGGDYAPEKGKRYVEIINKALDAMKKKEENDANDAIVADLRNKKKAWKNVDKETKPVKTVKEIPPEQQQDDDPDQANPPPEEEPPPEKEPEEEEPPPEEEEEEEDPDKAKKKKKKVPPQFQKKENYSEYELKLMSPFQKSMISDYLSEAKFPDFTGLGLKASKYGVTKQDLARAESIGAMSYLMKEFKSQNITAIPGDRFKLDIVNDEIGIKWIPKGKSMMRTRIENNHMNDVVNVFKKAYENYFEKLKR
jgi:hypothetical protein